MRVRFKSVLTYTVHVRQSMMNMNGMFKYTPSINRYCWLLAFFIKTKVCILGKQHFLGFLIRIKENNS